MPRTLTTHTEVRRTVRAVLRDDGTCEVIVSVAAVYDPKQKATTTAVLTPEPKVVAKVTAALLAAAESCDGEIAAAVARAVATSQDVARRLGEMV